MNELTALINSATSNDQLDDLSKRVSMYWAADVYNDQEAQSLQIHINERRKSFGQAPLERIGSFVRVAGKWVRADPTIPEAKRGAAVAPPPRPGTVPVPSPSARPEAEKPTSIPTEAQLYEIGAKLAAAATPEAISDLMGRTDTALHPPFAGADDEAEAAGVVDAALNPRGNRPPGPLGTTLGACGLPPELQREIIHHQAAVRRGIASSRPDRAVAAMSGSAVLMGGTTISAVPASPVPEQQRYGRFRPRRNQQSPDKQRSRERRRRAANAGPLPGNLAVHFTECERACLLIVANEFQLHRVCDLSLAEIAARAGTCRTTCQNALREAKGLGLILKKERPRPLEKSLTNEVTIISAEWLTWLRCGPNNNRVQTDVPHGHYIKKWGRYKKTVDKQPYQQQYRARPKAYPVDRPVDNSQEGNQGDAARRVGEGNSTGPPSSKVAS